MDKKSNDILYFVNFCINALSNATQRSNKEIYDILKHQSDCLERFVVGCYDTLHCECEEAIVIQIKEYLDLRGIRL